jgi:Glutamine synthetase, catalytic domain
MAGTNVRPRRHIEVRDSPLQNCAIGRPTLIEGPAEITTKFDLTRISLTCVKLKIKLGAGNASSLSSTHRGSKSQIQILFRHSDGIANKRDPGERLDINMYTDGHKLKDVEKLPWNLLDAIRALEASALMGESLGEFVTAYVELKHQEWNEYARHLTQWERENTLDC